MFKKILLCFYIIVLANSSYAAVSDNAETVQAKVKNKITNYDIVEGLTYKDLYRDFTTIDQKWSILKKLRSGNPDFARKVYLSCIESLDWVLRSGGIQFLASLDPIMAKERALKLFRNDPALMVRAAALEVLQKIAPRSYKSDLWLALSDSKNYHKGMSLWIRKDIAKSLNQISDSSDVDNWVRYLDDNDPEVVNYTVQALEKSSGYSLGQDKATIEAKAKLWRKKYNM